MQERLHCTNLRSSVLECVKLGPSISYNVRCLLKPGGGGGGGEVEQISGASGRCSTNRQQKHMVTSIRLKKINDITGT